MIFVIDAKTDDFKTDYRQPHLGEQKHHGNPS